MIHVNGMVRLVENPTINNAGETKVARYRVASNRRTKNNANGQDADFVTCVAFGAGADFAEKYLCKGMRLVIDGHIQSGSYTNREGQKVYTTDVIVENTEFVDRKAENDALKAQNLGSAPAAAADAPAEFVKVPDAAVESAGLPFD